MARFLAVLWLLAALGAASALAQPTVRLTDRMAGVNIGGRVDILEDPTRALTLGDVRRAAAAGRNGIRAFAPPTPGAQPAPRFDRLFLTHLHSDHTLGLADVISTPWIQGRVNPLDVYGPPGTRRLVKGILDGYAEDIQERSHAFGGPPVNGWNAIVHEISEGIVFRDSRVTVTAFAVEHPSGAPAHALRLEHAGRVVTYTGDTQWVEALVPAGRGADLMIAEGYTVERPVKFHLSWAELRARLPEIAPKRLMLTHMSPEMLAHVPDGYIAAEDGLVLEL